MDSPPTGHGRGFWINRLGPDLSHETCDPVRRNIFDRVRLGVFSRYSKVARYRTAVCVVDRVGLCETIGMTTKPLKVGDSVTIRGSPVICLVTGVDTEKNTADVKATRDVIVLHKDVPWAKIYRLDEGQSGLRIVTEATNER
jgi:hypothetical protein